jgi:hypothetical protein
MMELSKLETMLVRRETVVVGLFVLQQKHRKDLQ